MFRLAGVSASARPLLISGIAEVRPPLPVPVPTPAPVRLNQVSSVNWVAPRPGAAPNVTYWVEPFSCSAVGELTAPELPVSNSSAAAVAAGKPSLTVRRDAILPVAIHHPSPQIRTTEARAEPSYFKSSLVLAESMVLCSCRAGRTVRASLRKPSASAQDGPFHGITCDSGSPARAVSSSAAARATGQRAASTRWHGVS